MFKSRIMVLILAYICLIQFCVQALYPMDTKTPEFSTWDCGEETSLIQRQKQLELLMRTSSSLVSSTSDPSMNVAPKSFIFASCNRQDLPQQAWVAINNLLSPNATSPHVKPVDAFVWLGDAVYLDRGMPGFPFIRNPSSLQSMRSDYTIQLWRDQYCKARRSAPITGTWDDHDMGENDGDSSYADKSIAQDMFLDFLDLPHPRQLTHSRQWAQRYKTHGELRTLIEDASDASLALSSASVFGEVSDRYTALNLNASSTEVKAATAALQTLLADDYSERRVRRGAYTAHTYGPPSKRVKHILLDVRYHQDYSHNDILGETQWEWLESQLMDAVAEPDSPEYQRGGAEVIIIGTGLQTISWGKIISEGWRVFYKSRMRLMRLVSNIAAINYRRVEDWNKRHPSDQRKPIAVLVVSGDVHFAEMSRSYTVFNLKNTDTVSNDFSEEDKDENTKMASVLKDMLLKYDMTTASFTEDQLEAMSDMFMTPFTECTTSGITHAWGEIKDMSHILQPVSKKVFPIFNRNLHTAFKLSEMRHQAILSDASDWVKSNSAYYDGNSNRKLMDHVLKQDSFYTYHNFATVDPDFDADVLVVTVRNKEGQPGLVYPLPMARLRTKTFIEGIKDIGVDDQHRHGINERGYWTEALRQAKLENTVRREKPFVFEIVVIGRFISKALMVCIPLYVLYYFLKSKKENGAEHAETADSIKKNN